jgi:hypothetical protein
MKKKTDLKKLVREQLEEAGITDVDKLSEVIAKVKNEK